MGINAYNNTFVIKQLVIILRMKVCYNRIDSTEVLFIHIKCMLYGSYTLFDFVFLI